LAVVAGAAVVGALALASCATLNEEQCQVVDWQQLGVSDGASGFPATRVAQHQEACAKFGIPVNATAWQSGWEQGIRSYCVPANGLSVGRQGRPNRNACPADLAAPFNEAYRIGRDVYDARSDRDSVQGEIDMLIADLAAAGTAQERSDIQLQIELKRNALSIAQWEVSRAERRADLYELDLARR
jgi:hypothetical protein